MRLVIKPTATDSVIELKYNLFGDFHNDLCFRITRNISGTDVLVVPASAYNEGALGIGVHDSNSTSTPCQHPISWYDEPNTTSTVTYKLWLGSSISGSGFTGHLNRAGASLADHVEAGVSTAAAIENPKPQAIMSSVNNSTAVEGQVLETLAGELDGRTVTVASGTYTLGNVTERYDPVSPSSGFTAIPNCSINYKPPTGTKVLNYKIRIYAGQKDNADCFIKFMLYVDGSPITASYEVPGTPSNIYQQQYITYSYQIQIGGTDDIPNGKFSNWNSNKLIEIRTHEIYADNKIEINFK